eukprot:11705569-Prorocentrum_lima.AAC.1
MGPTRRDCSANAKRILFSLAHQQPYDKKTCKSCEYCQDPHSYSYCEDMQPDTDTESEWDAVY